MDPLKGQVIPDKREKNGEFLSTIDHCSHPRSGSGFTEVLKSVQPPLWKRILKACYYAIPFVGGCTNPLSGALNVQARATSGSVFFTVAMLYAIDSVICILWAWWSMRKSQITLAHNYFAVGHYVFEKPIRIVCLASGLLGTTQHIILSIVSELGGASVYTLGCVLGAVVTGVALDLTGLCWNPKSKPSYLLYLGGLAVGLGAIIHSLPILMSPPTQTSSGIQIVLLLISTLAGACMCFQASVGNKLGQLLGAFRRAAAWSFISGAFIMLLIGPYCYPNATLIELLRPRNWWMMSQAPLSVFTLAAVSVCQRKMSGPMVYCWYVLGQLASSTFLDHFGWVGLEVRHVNAYKLSGLAVLTCGVLLVTWAKTKKLQAKLSAIREDEEIDIGGEKDVAVREVCGRQ
eukprot:Blabericola_migrator_1__5720@NODE_28_length_19984_cov_212_654667_g25_i0_p6_GENE_NODE_28_length_19984_cov_212_654667_g25_i0NODE_28_length_19984_cov_212_654667_g25_i0_p6_ORF_typecomplete_len403_score39_44DMT_YdcZ/PF04657_13/3_8e11DMT_YdcZ/PF04657_13/6_5e20PgaD/PF13994_6/1_3e02PgaD/PF13994_6/0_37_NODE_28_length_19984_cov_212_654667_g25_i0976810976